MPVLARQDVPIGPHRSIAMTRRDDEMALIKWSRWKASGAPLLDLKLNGSWEKVLNYFKEYLSAIEASGRTTKALESKKTLSEISTDELVAFLRTTEDVVSVYCWSISSSHLIEIRTRRFKYGVVQY